VRKVRVQPTFRSLSDINVANLVDVVLVLLIIFMISAPLLQSGIEVELPQTATRDTDFNEGMLVTINEQGAYFFSVDGRDYFVNPKDFETRLQEIADDKGYSAVYLRADKDVPYGEVVELVSRIKKAGFVSLGLVTSPYDGEFSAKGEYPGARP
jgi:biopolymer transport protein TolR